MKGWGIADHEPETERIIRKVSPSRNSRRAGRSDARRRAAERVIAIRPVRRRGWFLPFHPACRNLPLDAALHSREPNPSRTDAEVSVMVTKTSSPAQHSGFAFRLEASETRRQFKLSLSVVVVLAVGIVSAALTFGAHPIDVKRAVVFLPTVTTMHAETNAIGALRS